MSASRPQRPSLSVVIPLYQEADNVAPLLARVHEGLAEYGGPWELICVDDGSRDGTAARLHDAAQSYGGHVRVIRLGRNFGQTAAMQAAFAASSEVGSAPARAGWRGWLQRAGVAWAANLYLRVAGIAGRY